MNRSKSILMLCLAYFFSAWILASSAGADQKPSIVLHFEPGKARMSAADKAELRQLFKTYSLDSQGRVFVVGYTDGKGSRTGNYRLSRKRADAVRREIVGALGIDRGIVMSLGKGAESPVATNRTVQGRSQNRRVEVYLANGEIRKPPRLFGPGDPYLEQIQAMLRQADESIKARRLADALQKLRQAHALGADHYAQWHTLSGIAGYYAGAGLEETRAHLAAALIMDPFDSDAREYLSRVEARQRVAGGEVNKTMGHTVETAIGVTAMAQQYEFLRLFEVEPLTHRKLDTQPVEMWQCVDRQGAPVVYYFNHSQAYQWAFSRTTAAIAPAGGHRSLSPSREASGTAVKNTETASVGGVSIPPAKKKSGRIWESKIFK